MSSEPSLSNAAAPMEHEEAAINNADPNQSKKASKKEAKKMERQRKRLENATAAAVSAVSIDEEDPLSSNYGDVPLIDLQSKPVTGRKWTEVSALGEDLKDQVVLIRGHVQNIRAVGKKMAFLVVREMGFTVQCVLTVTPDVVSPQMVKYATKLNRESIVDVEGVVSVPSTAVKGATQQVGSFWFINVSLYIKSTLSFFKV